MKKNRNKNEEHKHKISIPVMDGHQATFVHVGDGKGLMHQCNYDNYHLTTKIKT